MVANKFLCDFFFSPAQILLSSDRVMISLLQAEEEPAPPARPAQPPPPVRASGHKADRREQRGPTGESREGGLGRVRPPRAFSPPETGLLGPVCTSFVCPEVIARPCTGRGLCFSPSCPGLIPLPQAKAGKRDRACLLLFFF